MSAFTQRMQDCLHFIERSVAATGVSPSMQEICAGVGLSPKSKAYASALVRSLEERGAVRRVRMADGKIARRGIALVRQCCPHCGERLAPGTATHAEPLVPQEAA
jgi:SOS-response transcriptional repressor LexA